MPTQVKFKVKGLKELEARMREAPQKTLREMQRAIDRVVKTVEADAKQKVPVDRGQLRSSIQSSTKGLEGRVDVKREYGVNVHEGRKPGHFPPHAPIKSWARRKGISNWYAVVRKIGLRGIEPVPFLEDAVTENVAKINRIMRQLSDKIVVAITVDRK